MSVVVFIGPTIQPGEVQAQLPGARCLPPVQQGDVYRVVRQGATSIGIIDGFFSGAPSVWHKEVLWALAKGTHVFGSASMGALRAAELHSFGMRGVGRIFEWFRDGALEDDDEVAIIHGPAELAYLPLSEPMVNIRATLECAGRASVISPSSLLTLSMGAKALFFPERNWPNILAAARKHVEASELAAFEAWLPLGRIDQKLEDARSMLRVMREAGAGSPPFKPSFRFVHTHFWEALVSRCELVAQHETADPEPESILDELRLEGVESYGAVRARATARLVSNLAKNAPEPPTEAAVKAWISHFRQRLGLPTLARFDAWMKANHTTPEAMENLAARELSIAVSLKNARSMLIASMLDELRLADTYTRYAGKAFQKMNALPDVDGRLEAGNSSSPDTLQIRLWYFAQRLKIPVPDNIYAYAADLDYANLNNFNAALRDEYNYVRLNLAESEQ